ncbi:MAG TPA: ABC transporter ATP-binding protein [Thermoplasmata archaeon]|nr:ABC transporter ATP-binding protein [Thermoplasmata archaeon]
MSEWSVDRLEASSGPFRLGPVHLTIGSRESVAVLGRSGAGKTTLLRALAGFLPLASGSIRRDSEPVADWAPERRGAVFVPQGLGLFPHRSVERNVAFPIEVQGADPAESVDPLLERFGLRDLAGRRPASLSSGEQQRVALARSIAARPRLLLWDEPLGALDLLTRDELLRGLREVRSRDAVPLVFVTHDPTLAYSLADRWLIMDRGRVLYLGRPGPLLARPIDRFVARFVGYENVYDPETLRAAADSPLAATLRAQSGPEGIALPTPLARRGRPGPGEFPLDAERLEPTPDGLRVDGRSQGLPVRALLRSGVSDSALDLEPMAFSLSGARVAPIGGGEVTG